MNKNGLVARLAIVVMFSAAAVGLIASQIFYRITYLNELESNKQKIGQLHNTVAATASIATYLEDEELATEVINGLISNDVIKSAAIVTDKLNLFSKDYQQVPDVLIFDLYSPFEKQRKVGTLSIVPDVSYIQQKARSISDNNTLVITVEAAIITLIAIVIVHLIMTKPILAIGKMLHQTIPGTAARINTPEYHQTSELGVLVDDINGLLEQAEQQLFSERSLRAEVELLEKRFRMLFENATTPIVLCEPQGNILLYNEAFVLLTKKLAQPLKKNYGSFLKQLFIEQKQLEQLVLRAFANDETAMGEFQLLTPENGESSWVQAVISSTITTDFKEYNQVTLHDISKRKKQLELLDHKANYDQLTQLLNRHAAEKNIQSLIELDMRFALIMIDLDDFKPINDIYGHDAGDEVLIHVAGQLVKSIRKGDVLARWGGDEFIVLLLDVTRSEVEQIADKLINQLNRSHYLNEHEQSVSVSASMGVSFYPDTKKTMFDLIKSADMAMYCVKSQKDNPNVYLAFYHENMHDSESL